MSKLSVLQRKAFDAYDAALANYATLGVKHEQATRHPLPCCWKRYARAKGWTLVLEQELPGKRIRPDATLVDEMQLPRGYWEAKDADDVLEVEIKRKIDRGYPLSNTIFEDTRRAVLYQNGRLAVEAQIANRAEFAALLDQFFDFTEEQVADFYQAVKVFGEKIPELARA